MENSKRDCESRGPRKHLVSAFLCSGRHVYLPSGRRCENKQTWNWMREWADLLLLGQLASGGAQVT